MPDLFIVLIRQARMQISMASKRKSLCAQGFNRFPGHSWRPHFIVGVCNQADLSHLSLITFTNQNLWDISAG